jgi:ABC-type nitrate/sulfonate/bicarbonate transport system substrate-binding protein
MKRISVIGVVAAAVMAGNVPALAQSANNGMFNLSLAGVSLAPVEWPVYVADAKGFFAKQHLTVKYAVISPSNITGSLIGGAVDIGLIPAYQLVLAVQKGADLVAFGQGLDPSPYYLMVPASIKTFADLKGKTIAAATPRDVYTIVLQDILRKGGLDPDKDVHFLYGNNSNQRTAALLNGAIQAALQIPPETGLLEDKGFHSLAFFPDYYKKLTLSLRAVRRDWAEKNADQMRAYMRALAEASAWIDDPANKQEAIDILVKATKTNQRGAEEAYNVLVEQIHNFPKDACIQPEGMTLLISKLEQMGDVHGNPPVTKFIDQQWCAK